MNNTDRLMTVILMVLMLALFAFFCINIGKDLAMNETKYTLKPYTGVGSGVYKHGTIVKVDENGTPTVVGHFDDESGKTYPGTVQIEEVK